MRRLVKKSINAIFTDHPDRLLEILEPDIYVHTGPGLDPSHSHALARSS